MPYVLRYILNGEPTERWAHDLDEPETTHDVAQALRFASVAEAEASAGDGPWEVVRLDDAPYEALPAVDEAPRADAPAYDVDEAPVE